MPLSTEIPARRSVRPKLTRTYFLNVPFDLADTCDDYLAFVAGRNPASPFRYIVTPNVDHVVRINRNPVEYLGAYENAALSVNDSRVLRLFARLRIRAWPVFPGSDLVVAVFERILRPDDTITVIGGDSKVIKEIRKLAPGVKVWHHCPPMGFIRDPAAVHAALEFVIAHPSRFVFLAVGSPQQELLAARVLTTGGAVGLGLCVGSALHYLTGIERRAPLWVRRLSLEWAFRLFCKPRAMWRRYVLEAPSIFRLVLQDAIARGAGRQIRQGASSHRAN